VPQRIYVAVAEVDGVPRLVGLRIEPEQTEFVSDSQRKAYQLFSGWRQITEFVKSVERTDADPTVTSDLLRRLPLRQMQETAALRFQSIFNSDMTTADVMKPFDRERTPGQPWPDEHYQRVAEVYRSATSAPAKAICNRWNVSKPTAAKWIRKARELGHLGWPARPGVAGFGASESPIRKRPSPGRPAKKGTGQ
jgi:hypothetical protein